MSDFSLKLHLNRFRIKTGTHFNRKENADLNSNVNIKLNGLIRAIY